MIGLRVKNYEEFGPVIVSSQATFLPIDGFEGAPVNGVFTNYTPLTAPSSAQSHIVSHTGTSATILNPELLEESAPGFFKSVGPSGYAKVNIERNGYVTPITLSTGTIGSPSSVLAANYPLPGTLLEHAANLIQAKVMAVGKDDYYYRTKGGGQKVMAANTNLATIEPNPNCWCADWDFSGVAIQNAASPTSTRYSNRAGTAITRRHVMQAEHYKVGVGGVLWFMTASGDIVERSVIGINAIPTYPPSYDNHQSVTFRLDTTVLVLNELLPEDVKVYPVVGDWLHSYITTPEQTYIPHMLNVKTRTPNIGIWLNQGRRAGIAYHSMDDCESFNNQVVDCEYEGQLYSLPIITRSFFADAIAGPFHQNYIGKPYHYGVSGDSGSPILFPLTGNELALLSHWSYPMGGPAHHATRFNALIASADADAIARGNLASPTGLTVTVAPDPTL